MAELRTRFNERTVAGDVPAHRPDLGPCLLWTGYIDPDGYGRIWFDGANRGAHRVAVEMVHGPIADGYEPDHLCLVRACVEETHLEVVTHAENARRGGASRQGRQIGNAAIEAAKTHCPRQHPYDEQNTRITPAGKRVCRACDRTRKAA